MSTFLGPIRQLGYVVDCEYHDCHVIRATSTTGETWTVRAADAYTAACELAGQVGIELEDG